MRTTTDRPNILVFLTDDHAQWAARCYGNRELVTPSMDHLAHTGTRFANARTPTAVCSPARASFWTGTIPSWHGVHDHLANPDHPGITGQPTLAPSLQRAGYHTGLIGKWHCHPKNLSDPQPGFDRWFTQAQGTGARFGPQPFYDQDRIVEYHGHQAPIITDAAVDFLRQAHAGDKRWFCHVGYMPAFPEIPEPCIRTSRPVACLPKASRPRIIAAEKEANLADRCSAVVRDADGTVCVRPTSMCFCPPGW